MLAWLLSFVCMAAVVVGSAFVVEWWGRAVLAAGVCGLLVLHAYDRARGG